MRRLALCLILLPGLLGARKLIVISPHGDDFVIYAGGSIAKMAATGDEIYLVRVTNDEKHSTGISTEETRVRSTGEVERAARILGIHEVIHLNYKDGEMQGEPETGLRARFITLFRTIRPDALMTCDPWTRYDDNFDHEKVGHAVEDAAWTGGNDKFHPELNRAGLKTYSVPARYYWSAGQRYVNQVSDVSATLKKKKQALAAIPMFTAYRPQRLRGHVGNTEEFHYTTGSGLQGPYVEWYEQQLKSGKEWAAPVEAVKVVQPESGRKSLAIVTPHADDWSGFAGGTIARMIQAGWTAYIIQVSNDEKDYQGLGYSAGQTIEHNLQELRQAARLIGVKEVISLNLKNDEMESFPHTEMRDRLIMVFRTLKPDALVTYDPWTLYERNPDHARVARVTAEAAWAAGNEHFNPEQIAAGLKPHTVRERYYYARGPADINRVFDITGQMDLRIRVVQAHKTMMQSTANKIREQLAIAGLRMPQLEKEGDRFYLRMVEIYEKQRAETVGKNYGLRYAEEFHYEAE
jgi:LmbE family N-acetylglucosaminyl deacetylase